MGLGVVVRNLSMKKFLFFLIGFALVFSAHAQFFGGWADGVTNVPTGKNTIGPGLRIVYENFTFDLAGDIISFDLVGGDTTGSPVGTHYEIRTGMSAGNGGTLLFSGDSIGATFVPLPLDGSAGTPPSGIGTYGRYAGGPLSTIHLEAGSYWIGLAPLESFGSFNVTSTSGSGSIGHPINDGNAFYYNSADASQNFISMGDLDFGLRIYTAASTIPETGTLTLVALGGFALLGLRKC